MLQRQEVEVWYVIPAIKRDLAVELNKKGLKNTEIARLLKITKASVTNYKKNKRAKEDLKEIKKEIRIGAERIKEGECPSEIIQKLTIVAMQKGATCRIHKKIDNIKKECRICNKLYKKIKVEI